MLGDPSPSWGEAPKLFPGQSFIDTRVMGRHAGQELPPLMLLSDLPSAEPLLAARPAAAPEVLAPLRKVAEDRALVVSGGYQEGGAISTQSGLARMDQGEASVWAGTRHDHVHPYEDGGGNRINYSYDRLNSQMAANWRFSPQARLSGFAMHDSFRDVRLPNYGVDAPEMDRTIASSVFEATPSGAIERVELGLTHDRLTYTSDNVSLRTPSAVGLFYRGAWTATRGVARGEFTSGVFRNTVTVDGGFMTYNIDVARLAPGMGIASHRLPDVQMIQGGLTFATATAMNSRDRLSAALRLDGLHSQANKRSDTPNAAGSGAATYAVTPQQLWDGYYGAGRDSSPTDLNVSGRVRWEHDLAERGGQVYADLRRAVRNPDAGERFYASSGPAALVQVGDPQLSPEAHHRSEVGGRLDFDGFAGSFAPKTPEGAWRVAASGYFDRVSDFITPDRARGQPGILMSNKAIVYRNVDAYLAGAALESWWQVSDRIAARGRLSWTRGANLSDHRPLYQIPPLEGEAVIEYRRDVMPDATLNLGTRLGFAATQNRIDADTSTGSGQDTTGATGGWATLDLFCGMVFYDRLGLSAGVSNLLDKRYHLHANPMPQSATTRAQYAPGRSVFVMGSLAF
ncbi:Outer membrane receptor protein [Candidatus Terasakiella magnetica]|nr:Outer membrane receptor protein [Candidatus Terasakiella magnetica]